MKGVEIRSKRKIAIKILHPKSTLEHQGDLPEKDGDEIYDAMAKSMLEEIRLLKVHHHSRFLS
jgi:hypothetical protein